MIYRNGLAVKSEELRGTEGERWPLALGSGSGVFLFRRFRRNALISWKLSADVRARSFRFCRLHETFVAAFSL